MQSAGRGASALVMITADLTCRPRGDAATAPVVISSRCHNNCDYAQGAITLYSDLKYDNEMRSSSVKINFILLFLTHIMFLIEICGIVCTGLDTDALLFRSARTSRTVYVRP